MKKERIIFVIIFIIIFAVMSLGYIIIEPKEYSSSEKRQLAKFPEFSIENIKTGNFMKDYEEYIDDHVLFRDNWISLSSYFNILLGNKELNGVIIGDNQLFNKFEYTDKDKEVIDKNIGFINKFVENNDAYFMLIPTTELVVSDKLPKFYNSVNQDNIIKEIYSNVDINTIDVAKSLFENKLNMDNVYYKTDPHWTIQGSYYGYLALCESLGIEAIHYSETDYTIIKNDYKGTIYNKINVLNLNDKLYKLNLPENIEIEVIINEDDSKVYDNLYFEEYLDSIDNYSVYLGGNNSITRVKSNIVPKRKLLMIKDSFSHTLIPYLINHYSEIVMIDFRYYTMGLSNMIEKEKFDDIVIIYNLNNFKSDKGLVFLSK